MVGMAMHRGMLPRRQQQQLVDRHQQQQDHENDRASDPVHPPSTAWVQPSNRIQCDPGHTKRGDPSDVGRNAQSDRDQARACCCQRQGDKRDLPGCPRPVIAKARRASGFRVPRTWLSSKNPKETRAGYRRQETPSVDRREAAPRSRSHRTSQARTVQADSTAVSILL
jgi:hypothetical protein